MNDVPAELLDYSALSAVRDPYPMFAEMRRTERVPRLDLPHRTVYLALRYDDVAAVLRDSETFSSSIMSQVMGPVMGRTILELDGREHTRQRGLIWHAFRPRAIQRYAERLVEPLVREMLGRIAANGQRAELVRQLTSVYPIVVIARLLGLPSRDHERFREWSLAIIDYKPQKPQRGLAASQALRKYLAPILAQRRAAPEEDLISELVQAEVDGHRLSDEEIYGFLLLLLPAGAETTYRLLGNTLFALLSHPDQLEGVRADPDEQLVWALEETLRWEPPLLGTARIATRAALLGGVHVPKGQMVSAMIGPANRDPEHYSDPDRFDVHRRADDHLSFGLGKHFCLGYHLARLEVLTAIRALLERFPGLRLDPSEDAYIQGLSFRSPNQLPVILGS